MTLRMKPKCPPITPRRLQLNEASPVQPKAPDTEQWMCANPDKVIRLEPGVWSHPLMFDLAGS